MFKYTIAIITIGVLATATSVVAGRRLDNMTGSGGAFLRVECVRNGKTTLGVNVIPNKKDRPISYVRFNIEVGDGVKQVEQIFVPPTLNAVATTEINKPYNAVTFEEGVALGLSRRTDGVPQIHRFVQRKELTVSCN